MDDSNEPIRLELFLTKREVLVLDALVEQMRAHQVRAGNQPTWDRAQELESAIYSYLARAAHREAA